MFLPSIFASAAILLAVGSVDAASQNGMVRRHHSKMAARSVETHSLQKRSFSGKATYYGMSSGDQGACGNMLNSDEFTVALNEVQYGNLNARSSYCGKTITISNGVKTTQAKITDACPTGVQCHFGALDMSTSLFQFFEPMSVGVFDITWWISGEGGGSSGGSSNSASSSSSSSSSNDDSSSSSSSSSSSAAASASSAHSEMVQKKKDAATAAAKKAAKEKKKAAEKAAEKKAAEKKKAEALKKKKAAEKKKKEEEKAAKIAGAQQENIASFGEIMQSLNNLVEDAVDTTAPVADPSAATSTVAADASVATTASVAAASTLAPTTTAAVVVSTTV
jgi:hypothetical protein